MTDIDKVVAGLTLMNAVIAAGIQLAVYIALRIRVSRPTAKTVHPLHCKGIVASGWVDGTLHTATCVLRAEHPGDHATTLRALEFIGYTQIPF